MRHRRNLREDRNVREDNNMRHRRNLREDRNEVYSINRNEDVFDFCMDALTLPEDLDELIERVEREFGEQVAQKNINSIEKIWGHMSTGVWVQG